MLWRNGVSWVQQFSYLSTMRVCVPAFNELCSQNDSPRTTTFTKRQNLLYNINQSTKQKVLSPKVLTVLEYLSTFGTYVDSHLCRTSHSLVWTLRLLRSVGRKMTNIIRELANGQRRVFNNYWWTFILMDFEWTKPLDVSPGTSILHYKVLHTHRCRCRQHNGVQKTSLNRPDSLAS